MFLGNVLLCGCIRAYIIVTYEIRRNRYVMHAHGGCYVSDFYISVVFLEGLPMSINNGNL